MCVARCSPARSAGGVKGGTPLERPMLTKSAAICKHGLSFPNYSGTHAPLQESDRKDTIKPYERDKGGTIAHQKGMKNILKVKKMSETEAEKLLQKIASQPKKKGAARLRDMFDSLEAALSVKTREEVFKELEQINLGISFNTFRKTIDRIRKERKSLTGVNKPAVAAAGTPTPAVTPVPTPVPTPAAGDTPDTPAKTEKPTKNDLVNGDFFTPRKNPTKPQK